MTTEQKRLLYEIADWHSQEFYINMKDTWNLDDSLYANKCWNKIRELEAEYKRTYGDLPEWKYIDDVWETMGKLGKELGI
jgi:hypothetical protein